MTEVDVSSAMSDLKGPGRENEAAEGKEGDSDTSEDNRQHLD